MNKIRTVNTAFAEIIEKDPDTALTKTAIRRILKSGAIPSLQVGNKVIFDMNDLEEILDKGFIKN